MPAFSESALQTWSIVWHLVMATASAITAILAREMWQKQIERHFRTTMFALGITALVQLVLGVLALWPVVPLFLVRALDTTCALLVGWGLAAPFLPSAIVGRVWIAVGLLADLVLGILSYSAWTASQAELNWTLIGWGLLSALWAGCGAAALVLITKSRHPFLIGALSVLSLGALVWTFGPEAAGRALWLSAFVTLPISIMRQVLRDLESTERELQTFSQHALRQTQQMLTLLRSSTTLVALTSVSTMLNEVVESIALGTGADLALVALIGDDPDRTVGIAAMYPFRRESTSIAFPLSSHVIISQAVLDNRQFVLEPGIGLENHPLYALMGGEEAGPAIVQPMTTQDRIIGVIIVGNMSERRKLSEGTDRLLEGLGAQIATAVENVRMYHRLNAQAEKLARLLTVREEEASQRAAMLESIADGVVVTNKEDKVILANVAAANILGIARSELINMSSEEVFESIMPLPLSVFRTSEDASIVETVRMDFEIGGRSVQASLAPVQTQAGELLGVVAVLRDITRERQAELAKTEFIATISHELRTPLTAIKGYADLIKAGVTGALSEMQQQFIEKICNQTDHLIRLINAVIQYSELERSSPASARQPFDIEEFVNTILESYQERIEAGGLTVIFNVEPGTPPVHADPARTQQIVEQLLDNALRFMPTPGHIVISARPVRDSQDIVHSSQVALAVSDTGVGIEPEDLERVFERFYRADSSMQVAAGGLGLGLTIARALAVAQGGKLWAESPAIEHPPTGAVEGQPGATFMLQLPAYVS